MLVVYFNLFASYMKSRYSTWLSSGLAARKARNIGTSTPPGYEWAINVSADDLVYVCIKYSSNHLIFSPFMAQ